MAWTALGASNAQCAEVDAAEAAEQERLSTLSRAEAEAAAQARSEPDAPKSAWSAATEEMARSHATELKQRDHENAKALRAAQMDEQRVQFGKKREQAQQWPATFRGPAPACRPVPSLQIVPKSVLHL